MKKQLVVLFISAACLAAALSTDALAENIPRHSGRDGGVLLSGVACNAAEAARTFTTSAGTTSGYGLGQFHVEHTNAAATAVSLTCSTKIPGATNWADMQICAVSAGVCTLSDASWTKAVSADDNFTVRTDFLGASDIKCVLSCTGGGGSDTNTVVGWYTTL